VNKQLELLVNLQSIDREIKRLEDSLKNIPLEIEQLSIPYKQLTEEIEGIKKGIELDNKERREKERGVEIENDRLSKLKEKLSLVKTNEEYSAVIKEMDSVKEKIRGLEDEDLTFMELVEEKQKKLKENEKILGEEKKKVQAAQGEGEVKMEGLKNSLQDKLIQRKSVSELIDKRIFQDYVKVAKNRGGIAVVRFAEGICQGCFLGLSPQLSSEIRKNEELIKCPHCQRMLYWTG
jgi:predicted  nucleic acid-binding Zn-ribbon protein